MQKGFESIIPRFPVNLRTCEPKYGQLAPGFSIKFETEEMAKEFLNQAIPMQITWEDPRNKELKAMKFSKEKPYSEKQVNKILGSLWQNLREPLSKAETWKKASMSLGQNGPKGLVFVKDSEIDDVYVLYNVTKNALGLPCGLDPVEDSLKHFGISMEVAQTLGNAALSTVL